MNQNALSTQSEWEDHLSSVLLQDPLKTPWKERPFHACVSEEQARCVVAASQSLGNLNITYLSAVKKWYELLYRAISLCPSATAEACAIAQKMSRRVGHKIEMSWRTRLTWDNVSSKWLADAISEQRYEVVRALLQAHHFNGNLKEFAGKAIARDDVKMLEIFLEHIDPRINKNELLKASVWARAIQCFDRLWVPSTFANKTRVLRTALSQKEWETRHSGRVKSFYTSRADKEKDIQEHEKQIRILEEMIQRLICESNVGEIFFDQKVTPQSAWMIEHLSPQAMRRLKSPPWYDKVKDFPEYQQRLLREEINRAARKSGRAEVGRARKM